MSARAEIGDLAPSAHRRCYALACPRRAAIQLRSNSADDSSGRATARHAFACARACRRSSPAIGSPAPADASQRSPTEAQRPRNGFSPPPGSLTLQTRPSRRNGASSDVSRPQRRASRRTMQSSTSSTLAPPTTVGGAFFWGIAICKVVPRRAQGSGISSSALRCWRLRGRSSRTRQCQTPIPWKTRMQRKSARKADTIGKVPCASANCTCWGIGLWHCLIAARAFVSGNGPTRSGDARPLRLLGHRYRAVTGAKLADEAQRCNI